MWSRPQRNWTRASREVLRRLADGSLADGFPPVTGPLLLGIGQSMGGCMTPTTSRPAAGSPRLGVGHPAGERSRMVHVTRRGGHRGCRGERPGAGHNGRAGRHRRPARRAASLCAGVVGGLLHLPADGAHAQLRLDPRTALAPDFLLGRLGAQREGVSGREQIARGRLRCGRPRDAHRVVRGSRNAQSLQPHVSHLRAGPGTQHPPTRSVQASCGARTGIPASAAALASRSS
jgi:hypothetical protein